MPFPFVLPTTSAFSFSQYFTSDSHPALSLSASTYRGVVRNALKKHKRLPPSEQSSHVAAVLLCLNNYIPYLLAVDAGLARRSLAENAVDVILLSSPVLEWRPTLSETPIPGREPARLKIQSLEYEIYFVLSTLAYTYTLLSRVALRPLYSLAGAVPGPEQRTTAITTATKHLLAAASIHDYLATRADQLSQSPPCTDIARQTFKALAFLALGEATLLAVLKDDPYSAVVAQERNSSDKEWIFKAPEIPKVRANLFAHLCMAGVEHVNKALSLLTSSSRDGKVDTGLIKYMQDLSKSGRGKACRFFAIASEIEGATGTGIAWLQAGLHELGVTAKDDPSKKGLSFGRLKKEWVEKREDKRVEKNSTWGSDAGKLEEARVLEMLYGKWVKMNDMMNTQHIPPYEPLLTSMPSGREIYSIKPFVLPALDTSTLESMRAPPERADDFDGNSSSDDKQDPIGAFPGTRKDYSGTSNSNYY